MLEEDERKADVIAAEAAIQGFDQGRRRRRGQDAFADQGRQIVGVVGIPDRDMEEGKPDFAEELVYEEVSFLPIVPTVGGIVQLDRQNWRQSFPVAEEEAR